VDQEVGGSSPPSCTSQHYANIDEFLTKLVRSECGNPGRNHRGTTAYIVRVALRQLSNASERSRSVATRGLVCFPRAHPFATMFRPRSAGLAWRVCYPHRAGGHSRRDPGIAKAGAASIFRVNFFAPKQFSCALPLRGVRVARPCARFRKDHAKMRDRINELALCRPYVRSWRKQTCECQRGLRVLTRLGHGLPILLCCTTALTVW
jgi:hypothetical protein